MKVPSEEIYSKSLRYAIFLLLVNSKRDRIIYRLRDIFVYLESRHFVHSNL